jgi:hypothetical protein
MLPDDPDWLPPEINTGIAHAVDVTGWDFSWLAGRATEERPTWGYQKLMVGLG